MNRLEAIQTVIGCLKGDEIVVHANGAISRESFSIRDRKRNFYMLGSMGLASSIGLGICLARPQERVVVLDGDGNLLMGMGNMALIGAQQPPNLIHIVLDNQVYGTTGNQPTLSPQVSLSAIARACGYRTNAVVTGEDGLISFFQQMYDKEGPHFLQIWVSTETPVQTERIPFGAEKIRQRFMKGISKTK